MADHCSSCNQELVPRAQFCPHCGTRLAEDDPKIGAVLGDRYLLQDVLGKGRYGIIYRAEHSALKKKVAVRLLHSQLTQSSDAADTFRRKATALCQIDNDHLLQVLDFGQTPDRRLFLVTELLEGSTLGATIERDGPLAVSRAIDILRQSTEALADAHAAGLVHGDLRPRAVFLTQRRGKTDFVKLLDFGLVSMTGGRSTQMLEGDPHYLPPEQLQGAPPDHRSDIFSLGAIAYEMLAGEPLYAGTTAIEAIERQLSSAVPPLRPRRPECPTWLEQLLRRALAKSAEGRFPSVAALRKCLDEQSSSSDTVADSWTQLADEVPASGPAPTGAAPAPPAPFQLATPIPVPAPAPLTTSAPQDGSTTVDTATSPAVAPIGSTSPATVPPPGARPAQPVAERPAVEPAATAAPETAHSEPHEAPRMISPTGEHERLWFAAPNDPDALVEEGVFEDSGRRNLPLIIGLSTIGAGVLALLVFILVGSRSAPKASQVVRSYDKPAVSAALENRQKPAEAAPQASPVLAAPVPAPAPASTPAPAPTPHPTPTPPAASEPPRALALSRTMVRNTEPPPVHKPPVERPAAKTAKATPEPKRKALEPKNAPPSDLLRIARQKLNSGDVTGAAAQFRRVLDLESGSAEALAGLGECAFEQGDYQTAAFHLRRAVKLAPQRARFVVLLGQAYYKLGRTKDAVAEYRRALKLDPRNRDAAQSLEIAARKLAGS